MELLRDELPQLHGEPAQGLVRREGHEGQRVRLRLHPEASRELLVDVHLRPGAEGKDGRRDPLGYDRHLHRTGFQSGHDRPREAEVARGDGPASHDELGVLEGAERRSGVDPDRGLHAADDPLDREGRLVRQQRALVPVERPSHPA